MSFTLYGSERSRAARVTWMFRELGVPFTHVEGKPPAEINPNGKMPALVVKDDAGKVTFTLYESFAITTYLASKLSSPTHEGIGNTGIGGRTAEEDAAIAQWNLWGITELEMRILGLLMKKGDATEHKEALDRPLQALDTHLAAGKPGGFLVGNRFTVADLNVGSILSTWGLRTSVDWNKYPHVLRYATAIKQRPAFSPADKSKAKL